MGRRIALLAVAILAACAPATSPHAVASPASAPSDLATCRQAFERWVADAASLNSPGTDLSNALVSQERIQRRVFELCGLDEAERLNREIEVEYVPGFRQQMIEPDVRTFAGVECVDESPLLDGTRLCAEVGH